MTPPPPTAADPDCRAFAATVRAVLDREAPAAALDDSHAAGCPRCRSAAADARLLLQLNAGPSPRPPAGFAARVTALSLRNRRLRRLRRRVGGFALAAAVLAAVVVSRPGPPAIGVRPPLEGVARGPVEPLRPADPVRVGDAVAEAGAALAKLTRRATDDALAPVSAFLPPPNPTVPLSPSATGEPAGGLLAAVPESARAGLEPVTGPTRRAVGLFVHDLFAGTALKPTS